MAAPVQKGTAMEIGIGGYTYTGYVVEEAEHEAIAEIEVIKGEDNETATKIISDPGVRVTLNALCKSGSTLSGVEVGDTVTVNSVAMMVEKPTIRRSRGVARMTLTLVKEDSMTYT
jgi:hypothetical protein